MEERLTKIHRMSAEASGALALMLSSRHFSPGTARLVVSKLREAAELLSDLASDAGKGKPR